MDPRDASVYTDTWSPMTWAIILAVIILCVVALMVAFIALVHRSIENAVATPRPTAAGTPATAVDAPDNAPAITPPTPHDHHPSHAA